jgi:pimeloyl-ACP methyl ester carboxylesterase
VALIADETLLLEDGRVLAWAEWGDPRGRPLVFLHCSPGSRLFCPDEAATAAEGVRLITVDRPGYGGSDPSLDPTLAAFARDIARLVDHLWLGRVGLMGWSAGGQHATAAAALLGDRVSTLGLLATPAPDDQVPWMPTEARPLADLARVDPGAALTAALQAGRPYAATPLRAGEGWRGPSDAAIRAQVGVEDALATMWQEAFRSGPQGFAADLVAGVRPWGFQPTDVTAPTVLFFGADDLTVGPAHAEWWARQLSRAELTMVSHTGHLVPVAAWAEILRAMTRY